MNRPALTRDDLTRKALLLVEEACADGRVRQSMGLRFALAYLYATAKTKNRWMTILSRGNRITERIAVGLFAAFAGAVLLWLVWAQAYHLGSSQQFVKHAIAESNAMAHAEIAARCHTSVNPPPALIMPLLPISNGSGLNMNLLLHSNLPAGPCSGCWYRC